MPVLAVLVAGIAVACLLTAAAAVHAVAGLSGVTAMAGLTLTVLVLLPSGLLLHHRRRPNQTEAAPTEPTAGQSQPLQETASFELLERVASEVMAAAGTIRGFAQVLAPDATAPFDGREQQRASRFMLANSRDLLTFASGLHDYVRFERGRLRLCEQQVDAAELIESALALCQDEAEARDLIIMARLVDGAEIRVDAERIRQAIAGLVRRALATAGPAGILDVTLGKLTGGGLAVDIGSRTAVPDPLPGPAQLFEPRLETEGLRGFALPIAKRVALLHGGEVVLGSTAGHGASARLTLPSSRVMWLDAAETQNARAA